MDHEINDLIRDAVREHITNATHSRSINKHIQTHAGKAHFIPQHRVMCAVIQSLNSRLGNFIETILKRIIERDNAVSPLPQMGTKARLQIASESEALIDAYVARRSERGFRKRVCSLTATAI